MNRPCHNLATRTQSWNPWSTQVFFSSCVPSLPACLLSTSLGLCNRTLASSQSFTYFYHSLHSSLPYQSPSCIQFPNSSHINLLLLWLLLVQVQIDLFDFQYFILTLYSTHSHKVASIPISLFFILFCFLLFFFHFPTLILHLTHPSIYFCCSAQLKYFSSFLLLHHSKESSSFQWPPTITLGHLKICFLNSYLSITKCLWSLSPLNAL